MGGACPSRASVVPLGGWYSERRCYFHVKVEVSVSDDIPGGLRGSGQLIPPNRVEVRFAHNPEKLQEGTIQPDGSIVWGNGKTWAYGDARAQGWTRPQPDVPRSATSVDDLNAWEEARRERVQQQQRQSDDRCVYRTAKAAGKRFHYIKGCSHAHVSITASEAKVAGLTPCKLCVGGEVAQLQSSRQESTGRGRSLPADTSRTCRA